MVSTPLPSSGRRRKPTAHRTPSFFGPAAKTPARTPTLPTRDVWEAYRAEPTVAARNAILEAYIPLLRKLALKISQRLPSQVEVDDLVSAGSFGLMEAIDRYDPAREASFGTFCAKRIHGAIMDYLRTNDWSARLSRKREVLVSNVCDGYRKEFGRTPTTDEILERLGVGEEKGRRILADSTVVGIGSLSQELRRGGSETGPRAEELLGDERQPSGLSEVAHRDLKDYITRRLSRTERLLIILYYFEGLKMHEVGKALGISESRVSQLRAEIIAKLRDQLHGKVAEVIGTA